MDSTQRLAVPALVLVALAGCSHDQELRRQEVDAISARHSGELARFEAAQAEFASRTRVPQQLDFPGEGTLLVHECALQGYPGREELWLKYTYVNTTGHAIDLARITLTLRDPASGQQRSEEEELKLPLRFRFGPDSSYTTYLRVPTGGMHLRPGWQWELVPHTEGRP